MASKKKVGREKVMMKSTESDSFRMTTYNGKNHPGKKLELKMYCPKLRRHVLHKQSKVPK